MKKLWRNFVFKKWENKEELRAKCRPVVAMKITSCTSAQDIFRAKQSEHKKIHSKAFSNFDFLDLDFNLFLFCFVSFFGIVVGYQKKVCSRKFDCHILN